MPSAQAFAGTAGVGAQTGFVNGIAIYQVNETGLMAASRHRRHQVLEEQEAQLTARGVVIPTGLEIVPEEPQ